MFRKMAICWALAASFTVVEASSCWDLCTEMERGSIELFGEALYLRPQVCGLNYALIDNDVAQRVADPRQYAISPVGTKARGMPNYRWGYRFGGGYTAPGGCCDLRLSYARLTVDEEDSLAACSGFEVGAFWPCYGSGPGLRFPTAGGSPPVLVELDGIAPTASLSHRLVWEAADGEIGSTTVGACCVLLRGHCGVHWTSIRSRVEVNYEGVAGLEGFEIWVGSSLDNSRVWGVGPRAGVDALYEIACGLGLSARMGAAILGGELRRETEQNGTLLRLEEESQCYDLDIRKHGTCHIFPELDIRVGINYASDCCCWLMIFGEIGWEFRNYWNAIGRIHVVDEQTAVTVEHCLDLRFQGMYAQLGVSF